MTDTSPQSWNPERYERNAGFVADLGADVLKLLDPRAGERILDLGCGHGKLTQKLIEAGCDVVAVDASAEQVEGARELGIDARVMDATQLTFDSEFNAVFSNAVLHWVQDPDAAIAGVKRALKPGGRFVGEFGGDGNCAGILGGIERALQKRDIAIADYWPFYFASVDDYQTRLETAGFRVTSIELFDRPTPIPGVVDDWFHTFGESFLKAIPEQEQEAFLLEVREDLASDFKDAAGNWSVDYVRLRFQAYLGEAE